MNSNEIFETYFEYFAMRLNHDRINYEYLEYFECNSNILEYNE